MLILFLLLSATHSTPRALTRRAGLHLLQAEAVFLVVGAEGGGVWGQSSPADLDTLPGQVVGKH